MSNENKDRLPVTLGIGFAILAWASLFTGLYDWLIR